MFFFGNASGRKPEFLEKVALLLNLFVLTFPECPCAHCGHVEPQRIVGVCQVIRTESQYARAGECVQDVCVCYRANAVFLDRHNIPWYID